MVVVADAVLVAGGRSGGLDAADNALFGEEGEGVVDGLARDGADFGADEFGDVVGGGVGAARDGAEDGETLSGDLESVAAEELGGVGVHGDIIGIVWT